MSDAAISPLPPGPSRMRPGVAEIFRGFFSVGIIGFGGVLPLTRRMIVDERRWLTAAEFTELLALCQFLPGGNVINLSAAVGVRFAGIPGCLAALSGLMAAPMAIVMLLGLLFARFQDIPTVRHLMAGLAAAAAGLMLTLSLRMFGPLRRQPIALVIAALCFSAIFLLHWPLLPTMLVLSPISIALAWWKTSRLKTRAWKTR